MPEHTNVVLEWMPSLATNKCQLVLSSDIHAEFYLNIMLGFYKFSLQTTINHQDPYMLCSYTTSKMKLKMSVLLIMGNENPPVNNAESVPMSWRHHEIQVKWKFLEKQHTENTLLCHSFCSFIAIAHHSYMSACSKTIQNDETLRVPCILN